jgi:HEAT repeat protein
MLGIALLAFPAAMLAEPRIRQEQSAQGSLTPLQLEIEKQRIRLSSAEVEERRDAVTLLGSLRHPQASRVAVSALKDPLPIVRATAATSILSLPGEESAANLIPLLSDKDEFVRREAAFALGKTRSRTAVSPLIDRFLTDKSDAVRGAAAVALGQIGDDAAVVSLSSVLDPNVGLSPSKKNKKSKRQQNPFVLRAAARSLGQIGSRAGVPALVAALQNEKADDDVRRESAIALGMISDPSANLALRGVLTARDPHLAAAANESLLKILKSNPQ